MKNSNVIINSSVFLAYVSFLGWSVAYIYGWAKFYYYDYPWEFVEVGINNIARALGYILFVSIIIATTYIIGIVIIKNAKRFLSEVVVSSLRTFVVLSVVFTPLLVQLSLYAHEADYILILLYLLGAVAVSILCKKHRYHISIHNLINDIKNQKIHLLTVLSIVYVYFVLSASMIGYYAQLFPKTYAQITLFDEDYYILGKSYDTLILLKDINKENTSFFIYPCIHHTKPCQVKIQK